MSLRSLCKSGANVPFKELLVNVYTLSGHLLLRGGNAGEATCEDCRREAGALHYALLTKKKSETAAKAALRDVECKLWRALIDAEWLAVAETAPNGGGGDAEL